MLYCPCVFTVALLVVGQSDAVPTVLAAAPPVGAEPYGLSERDVYCEATVLVLVRGKGVAGCCSSCCLVGDAEGKRTSLSCSLEERMPVVVGMDTFSLVPGVPLCLLKEDVGEVLRPGGGDTTSRTTVPFPSFSCPVLFLEEWCSFALMLGMMLLNLLENLPALDLYDPSFCGDVCPGDITPLAPLAEGGASSYIGIVMPGSMVSGMLGIFASAFSLL